MAATEVLRPNNFLAERSRLPTTSSRHRRISLEHGNLAMKKKQHRKPNPKHDRSRSTAAVVSNHREVTDRRRRKVEKTKGGGLVMGQVILLRRGESLSSLALETPKSPEPKEIVPKNKLVVAVPPPPPPPVDIFAGNAFITSPSPRFVPQPSFFNNNKKDDSLDDDATRLLKRALRLEDL